jgi:hypothetical protein
MQLTSAEREKADPASAAREKARQARWAEEARQEQIFSASGQKSMAFKAPTPVALPDSATGLVIQGRPRKGADSHKQALVQRLFMLTLEQSDWVTRTAYEANIPAVAVIRQLIDHAMKIKP